MAVADDNGLPVAVCTESATPHEVTLVQQTLAETFVAEPIERLIGDNAYDSDKLDRELAETGAEMIAPHRSSRKNLTQDGRPLRRYCRRWKIERLFAWLQNFRRLVNTLRTFAGQLRRHGARWMLPHPSTPFMRCALIYGQRVFMPSSKPAHHSPKQQGSSDLLNFDLRRQFTRRRLEQPEREDRRGRCDGDVLLPVHGVRDR